jgi:hypothetical protein
MALALPQAVKIEQRRNKQEIYPSSLLLHPFPHLSLFKKRKRHSSSEKGASPHGRGAAMCGCRQSSPMGPLSQTPAPGGKPVSSQPVGDGDKNKNPNLSVAQTGALPLRCDY